MIANHTYFLSLKKKSNLKAARKKPTKHRLNLKLPEEFLWLCECKNNKNFTTFDQTLN